MNSTLAVFPLQGLFFFPGTYLPLHIFEPRYRLMMDYCQENDDELGVTCLTGNSMIDTTFGWGKIINRELLSDGRSNILLQGIGLATIVSYESTEPFIIASVEKKEMERAPSDSLEYKILLKEILTLTKSYLIQIKADWEFIQEIDKLYFTNSPVDIIASLIHFNVEKKRELLLTMDELEKARKLLSALQELGN